MSAAYMAYKNIIDAIKSENVDFLKELLQTNDCPWNVMEYYLQIAIEIGNMEILQVLMEKWFFEKSTYPTINTYVMCEILYSNHTEDKKLEMIRFLLPYVLLNKSNPIKQLFDIVLCCCQKKNFILVEFFINTFYSEEHNSLYPLIKKLQATFDEWHYIGILLHDDIDDLNTYFLNRKQFEVGKTFIELILKDTPESTELAVETMKVLLDKKVKLGFFLGIAMETGNMEFFQIVMEKMLLEEPVYVASSFLYKILHLNHDEDKKLEMVQGLLPYIPSTDSNSPNFSPVFLIRIMIVCCDSKNFILAEFLFDKLYSADRNKLYPLIEKLKGAVDGWHYVCILLHDGLCDLSMHAEYYSWIPKLVEIFLRLLLKDTSESMKLAVEIFQVLIKRNFFEVLLHHLDKNDMFQGWDENISTNIVQALKDSLTKKLLFQLIYNSINDKTQEHIYRIMHSWLMTHYQHRHLDQIFHLSIRLLIPFVSNPLRDLLLPYKVYQNQQRAAQSGIRSLKVLTRSVIRSQVVQNVSNIKEFMDRIWELKLPTTVKCFVLYIEDPSWMNNAQMS